MDLHSYGHAVRAQERRDSAERAADAVIFELRQRRILALSDDSPALREVIIERIYERIEA